MVPQRTTKKLTARRFSLFTVVLLIVLLVGWFGLQRPSSAPEHKPEIEQITPPRLTDKQATDLLAAAKLQIDKKDYIAAQSTLITLTRGVLPGSPQGQRPRVC
jgi:hypothetical protein